MEGMILPSKFRVVERYECTLCAQIYEKISNAANCHDTHWLDDYLTDYEWDDDRNCFDCEHGKKHHYLASSVDDPEGDHFLFCGTCKKESIESGGEFLNCGG